MIGSEVLAWFADVAHWRGPDGVPVRVAEHLYYTTVTMFIAVAIAVPLGLAVGHTGRGGVGLVGLANAMRALPTLGLLTFLFLLLHSQGVSTVLALVVLAVPPVLAGSYAGVQSVQRATVDAARGMGMTPAQCLWQVELPGALPLLFGGVRNAVLQVVATTTVAAYLGLGGLGRLLLDGLRSGPGGYPQMVAGALLTAGLALSLDLLLAGVQRLVVPTGVRLSLVGAGGAGAGGRRTEGAPAPRPESEDR
ncbi:MAG TPA: ABC transporter permease subunit [Pseudonocardiaceae bacterium]|nr:ABC transporter permease subunit [Pseudonocardiaceae bacterium]